MSTSKDFMFEGRVVGSFKGAEYPATPARYRYMPSRSIHHAMMHEQLRSVGRAICNYNIGDERVTFAVTDCPEYGVLELTDFTWAAKPPSRVVGQNWYEELIDGEWRRLRWLGPKTGPEREEQP